MPHSAIWYEGLTFNSLGVAAPHEEREFALPADRAPAFLAEAHGLMQADPEAVSLEIQIRYSPAIDVRLAANSGRDTVWFNINGLHPGASAALVDRLSEMALAYGGRPHWGKIIPGETPSVEQLYGDDALAWEARRRSFDPEGLFLNDWYHRHIGLGRTVASREPMSSRPDPGGVVPFLHQYIVSVFAPCISWRSPCCTARAGSGSPSS